MEVGLLEANVKSMEGACFHDDKSDLYNLNSCEQTKCHIRTMLVLLRESGR